MILYFSIRGVMCQNTCDNVFDLVQLNKKIRKEI